MNNNDVRFLRGPTKSIEWRKKNFVNFCDNFLVNLAVGSLVIQFTRKNGPIFHGRNSWSKRCHNYHRVDKKQVFIFRFVSDATAFEKRDKLSYSPVSKSPRTSQHVPVFELQCSPSNATAIMETSLQLVALDESSDNTSEMSDLTNQGEYSPDA